MGSARGSPEASADFRPIATRVQGEGPGTRCPGVQGIEPLVGNEEQQRGTHPVLAGW